MGKPRAARRAAATARTEQAAPVSTYTGREIGPIEDLHDSERDDARARVRDAWQAEKVAELATCAAVRRARAEGVSWHQVGLAVGYTAEGARKRWGPLLGEPAGDG